MTKKFWLVVSAGLLFIGSVWAQSPSAQRTFTFRLLGEPETLDWNLAHTNIETHILMNIMEGLLALDSNMKVVPALAKSWTRSEDGRTYTFRLRNDVKWTDGVPLKAKDFVYSWRRLLSPVTAASYAYLLFDIEGAEYFYQGKIKDFEAVGIKALDDYTLRIRLTRPVAYWHFIPTFWVTFPMRQDVVEKYGAGWGKPGRIVTLGPFSVVSHDLGSKIVLKANPTYYGTRGNIDQAVGLVLKDDSAALSLYESGRLDFSYEIATLDLPRLQKHPDLKTFPYLKVEFLAFAINNFPVSNVKVRRAIAMAIDRKKIPQILFGGQQPATSLVPPKVMGYSSSIGLPFDPAKARAELKASGLSANRIRLSLLVNNWDKEITLSQFIQAELKKNLGLEVSIQQYDHKTFRAQLDLRASALFVSTWGADYPDPDNFVSVFLGSSGTNRTNWKNSAYDELVMETRNLLNPKSRERNYFEIQKILQDREAIVLPLFYEPIVALVRPRVKGVELNPLNYLLFKNVVLSP